MVLLHALSVLTVRDYELPIAISGSFPIEVTIELQFKLQNNSSVVFFKRSYNLLKYTSNLAKCHLVVFLLMCSVLRVPPVNCQCQDCQILS